MCASCGCGRPNDDHGDSRNITLQDIDQAAQAAGTSRERVVEKIQQALSGQSTSSAQAARGDYYQSSLGREPEGMGFQAEQEPWQEGLPMSETGQGDVQSPQANP